MKRYFRALLPAIVVGGLGACSTPRLTVDDGRTVDNALLYQMRSYGAAAQELRPAIVRSAALHGPDCSKQYELPFEAVTAHGVKDKDEKVAWVRALNVNEDLRVIAAAPTSAVGIGEAIARVNGYESHNTLKMLKVLIEARDRGEPFEVTLASGRRVAVSPIPVCRGHVIVASPLAPASQTYHWNYSVLPLEVFDWSLTRDEAQWIVLWTQGLSEEGGARMKAYAFVVSGLKWAALLALGAAASGAASTAGGSAAGPQAAAQLAGEAGSMATRAAAGRATFSGVSRIAAGVFDRADVWAFDHMLALGMNPRAGLSLHEKLLGHGAEDNGFVLDDKRLAQMRALFDRLPEVPQPGQRQAEPSRDQAHR